MPMFIMLKSPFQLMRLVRGPDATSHRGRPNDLVIPYRPVLFQNLYILKNSEGARPARNRTFVVTHASNREGWGNLSCGNSDENHREGGPKTKKAGSSRRELPTFYFPLAFYCGVKPPMNVPQFAFTVRGAFGMYSLPIQMVPFSSET